MKKEVADLKAQALQPKPEKDDPALEAALKDMKQQIESLSGQIGVLTTSIAERAASEGDAAATAHLRGRASSHVGGQRPRRDRGADLGELRHQRGLGREGRPRTDAGGDGDRRPQACRAGGATAILVSTPTGSTAYAFSAGGPVMWPDVSAMLLVPLSAHALFNRPLVLSPGSRVDLDVSHGRDASASVWADGRPPSTPSPGACHRGAGQQGPADRPARRAALHHASGGKFRLPVEGFRGGSREAWML